MKAALAQIEILPGKPWQNTQKILIAHFLSLLMAFLGHNYCFFLQFSTRYGKVVQLKIKLHCRHAQVGTVVLGLGHEHAIGPQSDSIADDHALQDDTSDPQQIVVADDDTPRQMGARHEAVVIADDIVMANDDMIIDEVEITYLHITGDHAVVLNDITLAYFKSQFIDQEG